ncbi:MAG: polyprenyl synthetase family protein [Gemmatimonadota bacterium]|nr:polyprenyl synthetase family protein [Gemmatimonadota bacterium]MDH4350484.1 polyprenyl synthetase family protein [Gemmatimonadota bacterium]
MGSATLTSDAAAFLAEARDAVNRLFAQRAPEIRRAHPGAVGEAIVYALEGAGKRLRPALTLAVFREAGGTGDATELAAAVEVIHTYSLVHDDLPCMDDDDLRRGRPTVHRAFDVRIATEAGFRMVPLAAGFVWRGAVTLGLTPRVTGAIAGTLFAAAGAGGMIGGQVLDLEAEGHQLTLEQLGHLHGMKTGALLSASAEIGAMAAGASVQARTALRRFGSELGLAFQIVDDILDAVESSERLGKTAGKDAAQGKATYVALLGLEEARAEAARCLARAMDRLHDAGLHSTLLANLARFVVERRS